MSDQVSVGLCMHVTLKLCLMHSSDTCLLVTNSLEEENLENNCFTPNIVF